jgi:hypothetical protein
MEIVQPRRGKQAEINILYASAYSHKICFGKREYRRFFFIENPVDRTSAATHGGIDSSLPVKRFFYFPDSRI